MEGYKELYEKAEEELAEAKAELTELADKAEGFIKSNTAVIGIAAFCLVVGFGLGAALV